VEIPFSDGYTVNNSVIDNEILKLTDWWTDDLFKSDKDDMIIANFSRVFCDVERFSDDNQEIMAQFGMGVIYEKSDDGEIIRIVSPELRDRILQDYYCKHHRSLNKCVNNHLKQFGHALIIDCHSFPNKPFQRDLNQNLFRPDFNIGTDSFHTPENLIELSVQFFEDRGYSVGVDWPYSGSIVPMSYYRKNRKVYSIMMEINRSLYLIDDTNLISGVYQRTKNVVQEFLHVLRCWFSEAT
jgi:N-formylglutamate amidohydrolase